MKRLAFVATGYIKKYDGVSVYIENLLRALKQHQQVQNGFISIDIFVGKSVATLLEERIDIDNLMIPTISIIPVSEKNIFIKTVDLQRKLWFMQKYDVVFMANVMPIFFTRAKCVKVIHDLTIKQTPELFSKFRHLYIDFLIKSMISFDHAIGYISESTKQDIKRFYKVDDKAEFLYVPNGIPSKVQNYPKVSSAEIIQKHQNSHLEFIVVGRIDKAKGFDRILTFLKYFEFTLEQKEDFSKVIVHIVGKQTPQTKQIFKDADFHNIELIFHGFIEDKKLNILYKKSHFSFFLSRNEGYGLPLVEAMWFGAIPIVSDIPIFNEILGKEYPKFNDQTGYESLVNKFLLKTHKDKDFLKHTIDRLELIVEKESAGYNKAAQNLVIFINSTE